MDQQDGHPGRDSMSRFGQEGTTYPLAYQDTGKSLSKIHVVGVTYRNIGGKHSDSSTGNEDSGHEPRYKDSRAISPDDWALMPYLSQPRRRASVRPYSGDRSSHAATSRQDGFNSVVTRLRGNLTRFDGKDAELVQRLTALHQER